MSKEMKLLMELCSALGFDVETIVDRKERKEHKNTAMRYNKGPGFPQQDRTLKLEAGDMGMILDIDEDGMYTSYLKDPEISYKLTRKE
jgi:hypothetical protein